MGGSTADLWENLSDEMRVADWVVLMVAFLVEEWVQWMVYIGVAKLVL
jgi:hypothetical protein